MDPAVAGKSAAASYGSIGNAITLSSDDTYWRKKDEVINAFFRNRSRSEILNISTAWKDQKASADQMFNIVEDCIQQMLRYRLYHKKKDYPEEYPQEWKRFAEEAPLERFMLLTDAVANARKQNISNVNFQAIIEQLLLTFVGESDLWVK